jgi:hypothetical protein
LNYVINSIAFSNCSWHENLLEALNYTAIEDHEEESLAATVAGKK